MSKQEVTATEKKLPASRAQSLVVVFIKWLQEHCKSSLAYLAKSGFPTKMGDVSLDTEAARAMQTMCAMAMRVICEQNKDLLDMLQNWVDLKADEKSKAVGRCVYLLAPVVGSKIQHEEDFRKCLQDDIDAFIDIAPKRKKLFTILNLFYNLQQNHFSV